MGFRLAEDDIVGIAEDGIRAWQGSDLNLCRLCACTHSTPISWFIASRMAATS